MRSSTRGKFLKSARSKIATRHHFPNLKGQIQLQDSIDAIVFAHRRQWTICIAYSTERTNQMLGVRILGNEEIIVTESPEPGLMRREY